LRFVILAVRKCRLRELLKEADELTAIFAATRRTTKKGERPEITNHKSQIRNG